MMAGAVPVRVRRLGAAIALILFAVASWPAGARAQGPDAEALAILGAAKVVRVVVDETYGYRQRSSVSIDPIEDLELPFTEFAVDLLVGAGARPVGRDADAYDATLTIEVSGEALGTLYFDTEARFLYTGAQIRGALTMTAEDADPYRIAFVGQINRMRRVERDLGYQDPTNAPFIEAMTAPGSYVDHIVELVGTVYGAPALAAALTDGDARLRPTAARVLGDLGDPAAIGALVEVLADGDDEVRWQAAWSLGRVGDSAAIEPLIDALDDRHPDVRWFAVWSLNALTGQSFGDDAQAWRAWWDAQLAN